jgi:ABC-type molybdenum transport system ATPase subunit/photorepair protein PhrA
LHFKQWNLSGNDIYWIRGKPGSGKSTLFRYLLRGILGQLAKDSDIIAKIVLDVYRSKLDMDARGWTMTDVNNAFMAVLNQEQVHLVLTVYIDALDEFSGFPEVIAQWISLHVAHCRRSEAINNSL